MIAGKLAARESANPFQFINAKLSPLECRMIEEALRLYIADRFALVAQVPILASNAFQRARKLLDQAEDATQLREMFGDDE